MKRISVESSFTWAQHVAQREWQLLLPVALAFLGLPQLALSLFMPPEIIVMLQAPTPANIQLLAASAGWLFPVFVGVAILALAGGLAILALALIPAISVREAIVLAVRRLPAVVAALLLVTGGFLIALIVMAIVAQAAGTSAVTAQGVMMVLLFAGGIAAALHLCLVSPLMIVRRLGPIAALRASWALTRGQSWRLFGTFALYFTGTLVLTLAVYSGLGALVMIAARAGGVAALGATVVVVVLRCLSALVGAGYYLLVASFYRQLAGDSSGI